MKKAILSWYLWNNLKYHEKKITYLIWNSGQQNVYVKTFLKQISTFDYCVLPTIPCYSIINQKEPKAYC